MTVRGPQASEARKRARERTGSPLPERYSEEARAGCGINCTQCGLEFAAGYAPDPCIGGYIPDVSHACCGHGERWRAYVVVGGEPDESCGERQNYTRLSGQDALNFIAANKHLARPLP